MAKKIQIRKLTLCAFFTALISLGAFIQIPIPYLPITLQTMFVIMAGLMLGAKYGAFASLVYMLLGLSGVPIFTQGGGIGYVMKPSFGFIIGFVMGAFVAGMIIEKARSFSMKTLLTASAAGLGVIYLIGCTYMFFILNVYMNNPDIMGIKYVLVNGFLIFMPREIVTVILGAVLVRRLKPLLQKVQQI